MRRVVAVVFVLLPGVATAQPERYELGRRLKAFEHEWEKQTDPAKRTAALKVLPKATQQFFAFQLGEAGRTIDDARFALAKEPPTAAEKWLTGLCAVPEKRLLDASATELKVTVKAFYPPAAKSAPAGATATLRIGPGKAVAVPLDKLPATVDVPFLPGGWSGDTFLKLGTAIDGKPATESWVGVTTVAGLASALAEVKLTPLDVSGKTIEMATLRDRADLFADLADGSSPESDVPVNSLLFESGALRTAAIVGLAARLRPAREYRLSVPVGKQRVACRLWVPKADKPVPVVVALHGAGVSENMWFESYGAGHVVNECAKRGWLLVAPRSGFGGPPPVEAILDELGTRYDIDRKRVFLVGHSMGAANAVSLATAKPGAYRGVAALGGGGRATAKAFETTPLFVGVGSADFALAGARSLAKAVPTATLKEYPDVEHLVIVRVALPDAFAVFDAAAK